MGPRPPQNPRIDFVPATFSVKMPAVELLRRQYYYYTYDDPWYWIRWVVVGGILLILLIALCIAYWHARRRVKNGQRPLAYHSWMIPYRQRAHLYDTGYNTGYSAYSTGYTGYNVPLGTYPQAPPPMYSQPGQPPYLAQGRMEQPNTYSYPPYQANGTYTSELKT